MNPPNNPQNSSSLFLPRKNAGGGKILTRRNFLKAVGATAVALPFLKPQEARADTSYLDLFIRGTEYSNAEQYNLSHIPHNGVRAYHQGTGISKDWPARAHGGPVCYTIYPTPDDVAKWPNTANYNNLAALFENAKDGDMISCWQEPEGLDWHKYKKFDPHSSISGGFMQDLLGQMLNLRVNCTNQKVLIGAISGGGKNWETSAGYFIRGLDFYNLDLYRSDYPKGDQGAIDRLEYWQKYVYGYKKKDGTHVPGYGINPVSGLITATVGVTECNALCDSLRPCFFYRVATWVALQKTRNYRCFHTFWGGYQAPKSGLWCAGDSSTIAELQNIGNGDIGSDYAPGPCGTGHCDCTFS
jgi:hypothetical protein